MPDLRGQPDLDQLRHQAKDLLRAAQRGDPNASARIRAVSGRIILSSAQLALAREYGFASSARLKLEVERRDILNSRDLSRLARRSRKGLNSTDWKSAGSGGQRIRVTLRAGRARRSQRRWARCGCTRLEAPRRAVVFVLGLQDRQLTVNPGSEMIVVWPSACLAVQSYI